MNLKSRLGFLSNIAGLLVAWLIIFLFFRYQLPKFASFTSLQLLAAQSAIVCTCAIGMTFVIVGGGIDLSVGSAVALVTVVVAYLLKMNQPPFIAALGGIGAGLVSGLFNGALITRLKLSPFIVTLGTFLIARGVAKGLAEEQKIDAPMSWLNKSLSFVPENQWWKLFPPGVWIMLALAVLMSLTLRYSRFGRHVVAVGSNESAACLCGVRVEQVRLVIFALMGLFVGLAGLLQFSRLSVGDPTVAQGLELEVIAAVVIGGASLSGGVGSVAGSIMGALIMATIRAGSSQMGMKNWVQEIVTGSIIVLAVLLDRFRSRRAS